MTVFKNIREEDGIPLWRNRYTEYPAKRVPIMANHNNKALQQKISALRGNHVPWSPHSVQIQNYHQTAEEGFVAPKALRCRNISRPMISSQVKISFLSPIRLVDGGLMAFVY